MMDMYVHVLYIMSFMDNNNDEDDDGNNSNNLEMLITVQLAIMLIFRSLLWKSIPVLFIYPLTQIASFNRWPGQSDLSQTSIYVYA